jgi:hypothetical protein
VGWKEVEGGDGGSNVTNVQVKLICKSHSESLYNEPVLIKIKKRNVKDHSEENTETLSNHSLQTPSLEKLFLLTQEKLTV